MTNVQLECSQSMAVSKLKRATSIAGITPNYRAQRSKDLRYKPYPQGSKSRRSRRSMAERTAGVVDSQLSPRHCKQRFGQSWTMRSMAEMLENKLTLRPNDERSSGMDRAEEIMRDRGENSSENKYFNSLSRLEEDARRGENSSDIPKAMTRTSCGDVTVELGDIFGGEPGYRLISAAHSLPRLGAGEGPGTTHRPSSHTRRFPLACPLVQMPAPSATTFRHNWTPSLVLEALSVPRHPITAAVCSAGPVVAKEKEDSSSLMEEWMKEDALCDKSESETTIGVFNVTAPDFYETVYASGHGALRDRLWPVTSARAENEFCFESAGVTSSQPGGDVVSGENNTDSGHEKEHRDINYLRKQKTLILSEDNEKTRDPFSCLGEIQKDQSLWDINSTPQDGYCVCDQRLFTESLTAILRDNSLSDIFCHEIDSDTESLTDVPQPDPMSLTDVPQPDPMSLTDVPQPDPMSDISCHNVSSDPSCYARNRTEGDYKNLIPSQNDFRCQICDGLMETMPFINVCRDESGWLGSRVLGSRKDLDLYCPQCGCSRSIFSSSSLPDFTENMAAQLVMGH